MYLQSTTQALGYGIQVKYHSCKHNEKDWLSSGDSFSQDSTSRRTFLAYISSPRFYSLISDLLWLVKWELIAHHRWSARFCSAPLQAHFTSGLHTAALGANHRRVQVGVLQLRLMSGGYEQRTWKNSNKKGWDWPTWQSPSSGSMKTCYSFVQKTLPSLVVSPLVLESPFSPDISYQSELSMIFSDSVLSVNFGKTSIFQEETLTLYNFHYNGSRALYAWKQTPK